MSSSHGNVTDRRVQVYGYKMGLAELFNSMKLVTLGSLVKLAQYFSSSCAMIQFPTIFVVIRRTYRTTSRNFLTSKQTEYSYQLPTLIHVLHSHVYITCHNFAVVCSSSMVAADISIFSAAETRLKRE